jgi:hypothetical protein
VGSLFGFGKTTPGSDAIASTMYTPFHMILFVTAAVAVWSLTPSWDFTRRLNARRAAVCLSLFALSVLLMWTQTENPFLYFQF